MRLLSAYHDKLPHSLTVDYPSSEACGTKGSALCGALPSTPLVELVGEYCSWDAFTFMGVVRSPFSVLLAAGCHSPGCRLLWFCSMRVCYFYSGWIPAVYPALLGGGLGSLPSSRGTEWILREACTVIFDLPSLNLTECLLS